MKRLEGRVAIVTGGAGGLGAATTARFVSEGARVVVADIDEARANQVAAEHGDKAFAFAFDAADSESVRTMIDRVASRFEKIDILYNNLALLTGVAMTQDTNVVDTPFDVWNDLMAVNAGSYFAACKFAIPHMLARGGGVIINRRRRCPRGRGCTDHLRRVKGSGGGAHQICRDAIREEGRSLQHDRPWPDPNRHAKTQRPGACQHHEPAYSDSKPWRPEDIAALGRFSGLR